jgi:hypothetical protein
LPVCEVIGSVLNQKLNSRSARAFSAFVLASAFAAFFSLSASTCWAQTATIGDGLFIGSKGVIQFNQAAGVANQQDNGQLFATNAGLLSIDQTSQTSNGFVDVTNSANASIGDMAGANSSGLIQLGQAAGDGNLMANAAFIGVSPESLSPLNGIALSQTRAASTGGVNGEPSFEGRVTISSTAFLHASGVVQVDQVAGNNNLASNAVTIHVAP